MDNLLVFFELVRAGLWEIDARLSQYENINYSEVYKIAEEQSVLGLVAAGIEHIVDVKVPQQVALMFAGGTLQLERQNIAMNQFIGRSYSYNRARNACILYFIRNNSFYHSYITSI